MDPEPLRTIQRKVRVVPKTRRGSKQDFSGSAAVATQLESRKWRTHSALASSGDSVGTSAEVAAVAQSVAGVVVVAVRASAVLGNRTGR